MKHVMLVALLLLPQFAAARVYMCVDQETGKTSFTDKACETASVREEVRVDAANLDNGRTYAEPQKTKTWRSEVDVRKSGADYAGERRSLYTNKATASAQ